MANLIDKMLCVSWLLHQLAIPVCLPFLGPPISWDTVMFKLDQLVTLQWL